MGPAGAQPSLALRRGKPGENAPNDYSCFEPLNRGGGGLIRHGWDLFPLTPSSAEATAGRPALSPRERENDRQSQSYPMLPLVGGFTVHGKGKGSAGSRPIGRSCEPDGGRQHSSEPRHRGCYKHWVMTHGGRTTLQGSTPCESGVAAATAGLPPHSKTLREFRQANP